jgi:hypothetical protein
MFDPLESRKRRKHATRPPSEGIYVGRRAVAWKRIWAKVLTCVTWFILCALITAAVVSRRWLVPDVASTEGTSSLTGAGTASPRQTDTWGIRVGTKELGVGSQVYCLKDRDLGPGTVTEMIGWRARVWFESGEVDLPLEQVHFPDPVLRGAAGQAEDDPSFPDEPRARMNMLGSRATCPARPELGTGFLQALNRVFAVKYDSGVRFQTDEEVRSASPLDAEDAATQRAHPQQSRRL